MQPSPDVQFRICYHEQGNMQSILPRTRTVFPQKYYFNSSGLTEKWEGQFNFETTLVECGHVRYRERKNNRENFVIFFLWYENNELKFAKSIQFVDISDSFDQKWQSKLTTPSTILMVINSFSDHCDHRSWNVISIEHRSSAHSFGEPAIPHLVKHISKFLQLHEITDLAFSISQSTSK